MYRARIRRGSGAAEQESLRRRGYREELGQGSKEEWEEEERMGTEAKDANGDGEHRGGRRWRLFIKTLLPAHP